MTHIIWDIFNNIDTGTMVTITKKSAPQNTSRLSGAYKNSIFFLYHIYYGVQDVQ